MEGAAREAGVAEGGVGAGGGEAGGAAPAGPLCVQDVDVDFLPVVYEIIRSVEREFHDNSAKARESQECSLKVLELQKKFETARAQIRRLPGIDYNKQDQLRQFEILRTQLRLKRELLQKYRNMCSSETSFK